MSSTPSNTDQLVGQLQEKATGATRFLVAVAGPPGSGKSTLAGNLVMNLRQAGETAALVPMDGFHLDNRVLDRLGLRPRKGAPETFDLDGFAVLLDRVRRGEHAYAPIFDRDIDCSIAGAEEIDPSTKFIVVEGNYLLLDLPKWRDLRRYWDLSVYISPGPDELRRRLIARWLSYGLDQEAAVARADGNDMVNARLIEDCRLDADITLT